ncbi:growth-regulating factor 6-like [Zingiber officinale]|uniref:growth-regulating factor 6-like n=1 Tax=Zingiber officinale TaxID=94328 RepID=UPI001C4C0B63|nr:growth-regulating factor 6-like [Zingiber officinale]
MDALAGDSSEAAADAASGGGNGTGGLFSSSAASAVSNQRGPFGSVLQKHDRGSAESEEYDWRSPKVARSDALTAAPAKAVPFLLRSETHPLFPDGEQMLSFSSASKSEMVTDATLAYYNRPSVASSSAQCYLRGNAGLLSASSNGNSQSVLARVRGPFTPSQWLELEHQALIYKYLLANVPIPATLIAPLRRSLGASSWFSPLSAGSFGSVGWGSFYSGNADPEPGRCRRTDGKKWRCSRDAVADKKYCERHMNRGRHRSRKHVEGQSGHAAKATPIATSSQPTFALPDGGASSGALTAAQQLSKSLQSNIKHPVQYNGMPVNNEEQNNYAQNLKSLSVPNLVCQRPQSNFYPISKPHTPFEGTSSSAELGAFANDSVLNSSWSSLSDSVSLIPSPKLNHHDQSNPLRHFFDDCPKVQSNYLTATWPGVEETQSDRTQLSISNPISCSDFSSTTSSNHDILALSPLKLSREYGYDHVHMGLGMGVLTNACQRQMNWRPLSWEASISGPLGEVLNSTSSTPKDQSKNSFTSLNLLADDWDSRSRMEFSPTGVLQKTSLASLCSSTGSSPRAENRMLHEGTSSHCNDLNDSTLVDAPTIPPL